MEAVDAPPHHWFECTPIYLLPRQRRALPAPATARAWRQLSDSQRHRFHRYLCEGDRDIASIAALEALLEALARQGR